MFFCQLSLKSELESNRISQPKPHDPTKVSFLEMLHCECRILLCFRLHYAHSYLFPLYCVRYFIIGPKRKCIQFRPTTTLVLGYVTICQLCLFNLDSTLVVSEFKHHNAEGMGESIISVGVTCGSWKMDPYLILTGISILKLVI